MTEQQIFQESIDKVRQSIEKSDVIIDESKYEQIHGKVKGKIKEVFSRIKSFFNIRINDRNNKTKDENIK